MFLSPQWNFVSLLFLLCFSYQKKREKVGFLRDYYNICQRLKISFLDPDVAKSLMARLKEHSERFNGSLNRFSLFKPQEYQENISETNIAVTLIIENIIKESASKQTESHYFRRLFKRLASVYSDFLELTDNEKIFNSLRYLPIQQSLDDLENIVGCLKKKFPGNKNIGKLEESIIGNAKSIIKNMLIFKGSNENKSILVPEIEEPYGCPDGMSFIQSLYSSYNGFIGYSGILFKLLYLALKSVDIPDDILFKSYNSFKMLEIVFKIFIWSLMVKEERIGPPEKSFLRLVELLLIYSTFRIIKRSALGENLLKSLETPIENAAICSNICEFFRSGQIGPSVYETDNYEMKILENIDESSLNNLNVSRGEVRNHGVPFGTKHPASGLAKSPTPFLRKHGLILMVVLIITSLLLIYLVHLYLAKEAAF